MPDNATWLAARDAAAPGTSLAQEPQIEIVPVIATHSRPDSLQGALMSARDQTYPPRRVLVVGEEPEDFGPAPEASSNDSVTDPPQVSRILNRRTPNLAGALNTAIAHLLESGADPGTTYLAFLDDDDRWDPGYLEACRSALRENPDVVITGIIRHERPDDPGRPQSIPSDLNVSDFLAGNPHVQGSNLVIRLSTLLRAGCFDEHLPSTTDRDLMTRILDLGDVRCATVKRHLVHHWATDAPRLSTRGSPRKIEGLQSFLDKHGPRMTPGERRAFEERATAVFGWTPPRIVPRDAPPTQPEDTLPRGENPCELVVGFTVTWTETAAALVRDLAALLRNLEGRARVVVCDNAQDPARLREILAPLEAQSTSMRIVTREEMDRDADEGKFSTYYVPKDRRTGIAYGRTGLHRYVYLEAQGLRRPVAWILDDDVRLDEVLWGSPPRLLSPREFSSLLSALRDDGVSVAVGGIAGDPPLPAASIVRAQLCDLVYNLRAAVNPDNMASEGTVRAQRRAMTEAYPEYYYDLSVRHFGHLETPLWKTLNPEVDVAGRVEGLLASLPSILGGKGVFRPVEPSPPPYWSKESQPVPIRGGNTLVFDMECLKTYPNVAPRLGRINLRRGDTVWCLMNARLGGLRVGRRVKRVVRIPLTVRQSRAGFPPKELSLRPVVADIMGSALMRALDRALRTKIASNPGAIPRELLRLTEDEIDRIVAEVDNAVAERTTLFRMNAWRILGLADTLQHWLDEVTARGGPIADVVATHRSTVNAAIEAMRDVFSRESVESASTEATGYPREELREFLRSLGEIRASYSAGLRVTADDTDVRIATAFLRDRMALHHPRLIGEGNEGLVFTEGSLAFKHFYHGISHFLHDQLDYLRGVFSPEKGWRRVVPIERAVVEDGHVVFVSRYMDGTPYRGGHLPEILDLLRECREKGVVLTNLTPSNVVVGSEGLQYVDIGISVEPYQEKAFLLMCRKAYLMYRWHFREDLKALLTRSLRDGSMPELFGFDHFLTALEERSVGAVLHPALLEAIRRTGGRELFDYGCGNGLLSIEIARGGTRVVGYDIADPGVRAPPLPDLTFIGSGGLEPLLASGHKFPAVLCNLVLCTIRDPATFEAVLVDLRRLVTSDGRVIVGVCSPFSLNVAESGTHRWTATPSGGYGETFEREEIVKPGNHARTDVHRPMGAYIHEFHRAGFEIEEIEETPGTDVETLCPTSDFTVFRLRPLPRPRASKVSLMIKASAMEWRTIRMQVRHIVRQLEGPQTFLEKVVVTDDYLGPFARQYAEADWDAFVAELDALRREGTIDRVLVVRQDPIEVCQTFDRWFDVRTPDPRAENGQPTFTTLRGIEECRGEYVLHLDSDCLIARLDRSHDYLGEMLGVFDRDLKAVTVTLPVPSERPAPWTSGDDRGPWRTGVRCSLLSKSRLEALLPLPNGLGPDGQLREPWHRALDRAVAQGSWRSYRGGAQSTFFIHVPNDRKKNWNEWYNVLKSVESGVVPQEQLGKVDLAGSLEAWLGRRTEDLVFVVRGRNVPIPKLRRCVESLGRQRGGSWGVVFVDAASRNGAEEFLDKVVLRRFASRATLYRNWVPVTAMENTWVAVRRLCSNPNSIIVTVDADDALIGDDVVELVKRTYAEGADVTVGTMLRTDKAADYPVQFERPREHRGGNVWQHLRTFRKALFDRIPDDYLKVNGDWVPFAEDWAFMLPIVEAARRPTRITQPVYFYEPSPEKLARPREEREALIAAIVGKPPFPGS